jgi:hypothetical protein
MRFDRAYNEPDTWINKLESLRRRARSLGVIISGEAMILHILKTT